MTYALSELDVLGKKAARGAGLPWGLAEDAGKVIRWLASFGLPGPQSLSAMLNGFEPSHLTEQAPQSIGIPSWAASSGVLNPLITGAALSDCAARLRQWGQITTGPMQHPLLLLPFTGAVALNLGTPVSVQWAGIQFTTDGHAVSCQGHDPGRQESHVCQTTVAINGRMTQPFPKVRRVTLPQETSDHLSSLAERTLAPATEASRRLGAGADTTD